MSEAARSYIYPDKTGTRPITIYDYYVIIIWLLYDYRMITTEPHLGGVETTTAEEVEGTEGLARGSEHLRHGR